MSESSQEPEHGGLVVRGMTADAVMVGRQPHPVAVLRSRLPDLVRHPAVLAAAGATATVGAQLALRAVHHALRQPASSPPATPAPAELVVTGLVVHSVHVVHHVVHHVAGPVGPPALPMPRPVPPW